MSHNYDVHGAKTETLLTWFVHYFQDAEFKRQEEQKAAESTGGNVTALEVMVERAALHLGVDFQDGN